MVAPRHLLQCLAISSSATPSRTGLSYLPTVLASASARAADILVEQQTVPRQALRAGRITV